MTAREAGDGTPPTRTTVGLNGVAITREPSAAKAYRSYEVHQRRRVGQSTAKLRPNALISPGFLEDPYPTFAILREHYPCYRDWVGNAYWLSRYDDVTSVFVDDANFETRPKRWWYGLDHAGRDCGDELPVLAAYERIVDGSVAAICARLIDEAAPRGGMDLAIDFASRLALELLVRLWGVAESDQGTFVERYFRLQRGVYGGPETEVRGRSAFIELVEYFRGRLAAGREADDLVSIIANLDLADGPATAEDLVITLLEADHETLQGATANLWFLLLTHPDEWRRVREDRRPESRLTKLAYLEALRHSAPVLVARRFARHEVERFGQLLPAGALVMCAAGAANRDPRVFAEPDAFVAGRKDLTQREPRGMYRADGLASGIAFGLGKPSRHPALPEDRPRSRYAITRDAVVAASNALIDACNGLALAPGASPRLQSLGHGEMHTCWRLPAVFRP